MKKVYFFIPALLIIGFIWFSKTAQPVKDNIVGFVTKPDLINEEGLTVSQRVKLPEGFQRVYYPEGSFQAYIQNYTLKEFGAPVVNYDGSHYFFQQGHFGVLEVPVPSNGLQQCADALIRLRSEYLWEQDRKDEIGFEFTSGDYCSWKKYAEGFRPKIKGNKVSFHKTARKDTSKDNFYRYLNLIYTYSGTISLHEEMPAVQKIEDLRVGDMMIYPGSPGHVVMIADIAVNEAGEKLFIFVQGNTPAQSVHLLKNLEDLDNSPWYKIRLGEEMAIPGYVFSKAKFIRFIE